MRFLSHKSFDACPQYDILLRSVLSFFSRESGDAEAPPNNDRTKGNARCEAMLERLAKARAAKSKVAESEQAGE